MRVYGRQEEIASHCHLQWMKPLLLLSSAKCIWNTLLTFPLLMSLFIAPWFQVFQTWQALLLCLPKPDKCLCQSTEIQQWWRYYSEDLICQSGLVKCTLMVINAKRLLRCTLQRHPVCRLCLWNVCAFQDSYISASCSQKRKFNTFSVFMIKKSAPKKL